MTITLAGHFADRSTWEMQHCPVARAMAAIGPPSAVLVLGEAYFGTSRFGDFVRNLDMTESAVTARLSHLVTTGLLSKEPYKEPGQRTRYEYHLTKMGLDLLPVLVGLMEWGDTYLQGGRGLKGERRGGRALPAGFGRQVALTHADCDEAVSAQVRCSAGHLIRADQIVMTPAPPARPAARQAPESNVDEGTASNGKDAAHASRERTTPDAR